MAVCRVGVVVIVALAVVSAGRSVCGQIAQAVVPSQVSSVTDGPEGLGEESSLLELLRQAERDNDARPVTVAEAAAQSGMELPRELEGDIATQVVLPSLPIRVTPRIARTLAMFRTDLRARRALRSWVRRAGRYRARIESILVSEGVPADLVWIAAVESGFDPVDVSHAGAVGLWQLMPDTARTYGLRVDAWLDERRDPERATRAAARYLRDLYSRFRSWELALAAYNMGYTALMRAVRRYNTNDFETLASLEAGLPWETTHYVPRILSVAIAVRNASLFGLSDVVAEPALHWEDVRLVRSVPLEDLARAIGVSVDTLRALNPALLATRTPPADTARPFVLHVPVGMGMQTERALARLSLLPARIYRLRHGETVTEVALRFGLQTAELLSFTGLSDTHHRIVPGTELLVPDREPLPRWLSSERPLVIVSELAGQPPAGRRRVFYRVVPGDDLPTVARALGVRQEDLLAWNALDPMARLQVGMWLQVYLSADPPDARVWEESEVDVVRRGSEEFYDRTVASDGRVRVRITVCEGDTMRSVASRYGLSVGSLARINRRSRHSTLRPGEHLVVYTTPERLAAVHEEENSDSANTTAATHEGQSRCHREENSATSGRDAERSGTTAGESTPTEQ